MFKWFKKKEEQKETTFVSDALHESIVSHIYTLVETWWEKENLNAAKGTPVEQGVLGAIINFDFKGLSDLANSDDFDRSISVLDDIFTTKENCFINSRIHLMASEIIERFGIEVVNEFNRRLVYSFVNIWRIDKDVAEELVTEFPCLWLIHIVQSFAIFKQSNH